MSKVIMASSYGFCGGVRAAVEKAAAAADRARREGRTCHACGDIVHSRAVMRMLEERGMLRSAPESGSIAVIRAHGIGDDERRRLMDIGVEIADATCPVVLANMEKLRKAADPVIIGRKSHPEIQALLGCRRVPVLECCSDLASLGRGDYEAVIQTTLSDALLQDILREGERRGIRISPITSICDASGKRRRALASLIPAVDAIVIAGDRESSNTSELFRIAEASGKPAFLVSSEDELPSLASYGKVGLSAGASAPDELVDAIREAIENE